MPGIRYQSPLVSRIRIVRDDDQAIEFAGHYLHGDGHSVPLTLGAFAIIFIVTLGVMPSPPALARWALVGVVAGLVYAAFRVAAIRTRITLDHARKTVTVITRGLHSMKTHACSYEHAALRVENIHIRLAQDCGALDLVLPDLTIRLQVHGRFAHMVQYAESLSRRSGIAVAPEGEGWTLPGARNLGSQDPFTDEDWRTRIHEERLQPQEPRAGFKKQAS